MEPKNDLARVRDVMSRHRDELLARWAGVAGLGVGHEDPSGRPAPDDNGWRIVVYLSSERDRPEEPFSIEGVPVRFLVTGGFVAQNARLA